MAGFEDDLQAKIYDILSAGLSYPVYDDVPYLPEGMPAENFPYVVIGDDTAIPFDNDTNVGVDSTLTIHVWSRARGRKETKGIQGEIYALLNRSTITIATYTVVDALFEFSQTFVEGEDGATRHGVQRFRITVQRD